MSKIHCQSGCDGHVCSALYMIENLLQSKDVRMFTSMLESTKDIVLTCHVRPDGDAIGSTLGLRHMLEALGKRAHVITPDQPPRSLAFLPGYEDIVPVSKYGEYSRRLMSNADMIIACDFNSLSRQDEMQVLWKDAERAVKIMIDHHENPDNFVDLMMSYPDMSSTCEVVFRMLAAMGLYEKMPFNAAFCLCTGIITDTRNLTVNTKHLDLYDIMVALLKKDVPKRLILKETMETKSADALRLNAFALYERLKVYREHRAAIIYLTKEDLAQFNYERGDTEGLVNQALELRGIIYVAFMREDAQAVRVSMRSLGGFKVNKVCADLFSGGGHRQAAGGDFKGSVHEAIKCLEDHMHMYDDMMQSAAENLINEGYILN